MLSGALLDSEAQNRLLNEVRSAARLHNPNIVSLFDTGQEDQNSYIIMELVDGESLHDSHPESNEILANFAQQICAALDHAYQHGIIHRDLKPENILVSCNNEIKLTDLGLGIAERISGNLQESRSRLNQAIEIGEAIDNKQACTQPELESKTVNEANEIETARKDAKSAMEIFSHCGAGTGFQQAQNFLSQLG